MLEMLNSLTKFYNAGKKPYILTSIINFQNKKRMKKTMVLMIGLMATLSSFAQIKGKVVDQTTKEVLAGATISTEKGESTTSGLDGTFELKKTKKGEDIKVSYVGFKTAKVDAKDGIVWLTGFSYT